MSFSRIFLGDVLDFHVASLAYAEAEPRPLYFLLGDWRGLLAIVYGRTLLGTIAVIDKSGRGRYEEQLTKQFAAANKTGIHLQNQRGHAKL